MNEQQTQVPEHQIQESYEMSPEIEAWYEERLRQEEEWLDICRETGEWYIK